MINGLKGSKIRIIYFLRYALLSFGLYFTNMWIQSDLANLKRKTKNTASVKASNPTARTQSI